MLAAAKPIPVAPNTMVRHNRIEVMRRWWLVAGVKPAMSSRSVTASIRWTTPNASSPASATASLNRVLASVVHSEFTAYGV